MPQLQPLDKPPPRDYRAEVTADIIGMLERGTAPWQKPWETGKAGTMPYNPTTNKPYRGGNVLALSIATMRKGYDDPRWCTYRQAQEKGWQVRKGEKATAIEFWEVGRAREDEGESDADKPRNRLIHRVYSVFNAAQIDGIPPLQLEPRKPFEVIEAGEKMLTDSGADIRHGGDRAYYTRGGDYIQLPFKEQFRDAPGYYGTACHELIHWTGTEKRLNRETLTKSRGFHAADEHYAREELVAEIGSWLLSLETGLPHDPSQHTAYIASWLQALKKDKNEIFKAASAASKAVDFFLQRERQHETAEPGPHADRVSAEVQEQGVRRR
jgi:antirestriction protein ArdC